LKVLSYLFALVALSDCFVYTLDPRNWLN
jgi:hypothetical protein